MRVSSLLKFFVIFILILYALICISCRVLCICACKCKVVFVCSFLLFLICIGFVLVCFSVCVCLFPDTRLCLVLFKLFMSLSRSPSRQMSLCYCIDLYVVLLVSSMSEHVSVYVVGYVSLSLYMYRYTSLSACMSMCVYCYTRGSNSLYTNV